MCDCGPVLRANKASKVIEGTTLLKETSLTAAAGRCVVLRGPNGAGKTTLLRLLAGTTAATSGTVTFDDRPVDERDPAIRRAIAALLGPPTAYRDLTLSDHLVLVDATWGRDPANTEDRVAEALELFDIAHLEDRFPHELSSGQQQLFHLTLTLFRPSQVLLLDEPEQRLDTSRRERLVQILRARADGGTAIVLACHDPAMTKALADRIIDITAA